MTNSRAGSHLVQRAVPALNPNLKPDLKPRAQARHQSRSETWPESSPDSWPAPWPEAPAPSQPARRSESRHVDQDIAPSDRLPEPSCCHHPVVQHLSDLLGRRRARRLMIAFGGTEIYIPARPRHGQPIAEAIGREGAIIMARFFGGGSLVVPRGEALTTAQKHYEIRRAARTQSRNRVARMFGITERHVRRICNAPQAGPRTP